MSCDYCTREQLIISSTQHTATVICAGHGCNHRMVMVLIDEDCKQVIPIIGFGDVEETSTVW